MKPDLLNWSRWQVYTRVATLPFIAALWFGMQWSEHRFDNPLIAKVCIFLSIFSTAAVTLLIQLVSALRDLDQRQDELAKQSAIDNERIWRLEEVIKDLKNPAAPTP